MNRKYLDNRHDPPQTGHPGYTPGVGFTPPVAPPAEPPSKSAYGRSRRAWTNYSGLRQRARASSMSWWGYKAVQGLLLGGIPLALGAAIDILAALAGAGVTVTGLGAVIMLAGLAIILRYALAPLTCRWIVSVPENRYCVVEDADGYTLEYLEPGRLIVPWRWNARVRDYVDFNTVTIREVVLDALNVDPPVDIEVTVIMAFNPVHADPELFARLRGMTTRSAFETMIARDVRDTVRKHLHQLSPRQQQTALRHPRLVEDALAAALERHAALGLTLASSRPIMVHVHGGAISDEPSTAEHVPAHDAEITGIAGGGESAPPVPPGPDTLPHVQPDATPDRAPRPPSPVRPRHDIPDPLASRRKRHRSRRAPGEEADET